MANSSSVDPEYSVYVGNLNPCTALSDMEDLIYELFLQAGPLDKVFIPYDRDTGKHKGYGFVEFLHRESIQYSINLMNGICLLDRYLVVRTVTQRHPTPTASRNSPSLASSTTPGASKTIIEDNPFHSQAKPLVKITLPPPPSSATLATNSVEGNPFFSPAATSSTCTPIQTVEDNPFLSPAIPLMKVTMPSPGTPTATMRGGVSIGISSQLPLMTPPGPAHAQCTTPLQPPTPLFPPSAVRQQPIAALASNAPPPPLGQEAQNKPKILPLNPFLEPSYSPTLVPPNPFFQNIHCLPPIPPPPPLELTPPFAPPLLLPPPAPSQQTPPPAPPLFLPPPPFPLQQTPPLAPPPPIPLFPSPLTNGGSIQSDSSSGRPVPLFPDASFSPSQPEGSPANTVQSDESAVSENSRNLVTFDTARLAMSFQTPPSTPNGEPIVLTNNHMSYSGSTAGDLDSEMDFEPDVNGDSDSWSQFGGGDHERLHKGRIHANDHPAWLKRETKVKLAQYHLETLALELRKIKKST